MWCCQLVFSILFLSSPPSRNPPSTIYVVAPLLSDRVLIISRCAGAVVQFTPKLTWSEWWYFDVLIKIKMG